MLNTVRLLDTCTGEESSDVVDTTELRWQHIPLDEVYAASNAPIRLAATNDAMQVPRKARVRVGAGVCARVCVCVYVDLSVQVFVRECVGVCICRCLCVSVWVYGFTGVYVQVCCECVDVMCGLIPYS